MTIPKSRIRSLVCGPLVCMALSAFTMGAHAESNDVPEPSELIGSWVTTFHVTGFGGKATPLLLSFTRDGIVIETDNPLDTPIGGAVGTVVLGNGHGAWKKTGTGTFAFTYHKQIYNLNLSGFGLDTTDGTITLSPDGNSFQVTLSLVFKDNSGNVVFSSPGTGTATRIVVESTSE
jgi:hypothetical protein